MKLDAGGSGNYVSPFGPGSSGSISGNVDGRVNQGTWDQPGNPHLQRDVQVRR